MANVDILSVSIQDQSGDVKSIPIYYPAGLSFALVQAAFDAFAPVLDAAIDGKIAGATVQQNLVVPGGLKATQLGDIERGALIGFDAANTPYRHSIFFPTWAQALYALDVPIIGAGAGLALSGLITAGFGTPGSLLIPSDKYANDLVTALSGKKRFRK